MSDTRKTIYLDGHVIQIPKMDDLCYALSEKFHQQERENDYLREENERLKSEAYATEELASMQKELKKAKEICRNGFPISEEEMQRIREWQKKHDEEKHSAKTPEKRLRLSGSIGGRFSYIFTPTSIGNVGIVRCNCGEEFCFRELN